MSVPEGYMKAANGNLVPVENVKEIDKLRDELVCKLTVNAIEQALMNHKFKVDSLDEIAAFVSTSAMEYDSEIGGGKGNVSLVSYDGKFKILRAMADQVMFDERLLVAKDLIHQCLNDWTDGAGKEIKLIVGEAFKTNAQGQVSTSRIMGLRKFKFEDARWQKAMDAIADAAQVSSTKTYLRFYVRDEKTGKYELLPMDGSADPHVLFPD